MKQAENNLVGLVVTLAEKPKLVIKAPDWERTVYEVKAFSNRRNDTKDEIIIRMSGEAIGLKKNIKELKKDVEVIIAGQMASINIDTDSQIEARVKIFVEALAVEVNEPPAERQNEVHLEGNICKKPVVRQTAKSRLDITELIVAVNYNGKTAFVPLVCWQEVARVAANFEVGQHIIANGRLQSREYKKTVDGLSHILTAYEVSVKELGYEQEEEQGA